MIRINLIFCFLYILSSCTSSINPIEKTAGIKPNSSEDKDSIQQYTYLPNEEIESLLKKQEYKFLNYFWYGMSENECLEVLRYLVDQGKVDAFLRKGNDEEKIFSNNVKRLKVKKQTVGYSYPDESSRIMYLLQGEENSIIFELKFDFGHQGDSLGSLSLTATTNYNEPKEISLRNYNYLVDVFTSKYGKIVDKTNQQWELITETIGKPDVYKRCRFLKYGISVELEYNSGKNLNNGNINPQLTLYYQLHLDNKFSTYGSYKDNYRNWKEEQKRKEKNDKIDRTIQSI
jgi:hypothetical protein